MAANWWSRLTRRDVAPARRLRPVEGNVHVVRRPDRIAIMGSSVSTNGLNEFNGWFRVVDRDTDADAVGALVLEGLTEAERLHGFARPPLRRDSPDPQGPVYVAMRVRGEKQFSTEADAVAVVRCNGTVSLTRMIGTPERGGGFSFGGEAGELPATADAVTLGATVRAALDGSPEDHRTLDVDHASAYVVRRDGRFLVTSAARRQHHAPYVPEGPIRPIDAGSGVADLSAAIAEALHDAEDPADHTGANGAPPDQAWAALRTAAQSETAADGLPAAAAAAVAFDVEDGWLTVTPMRLPPAGGLVAEGPATDIDPTLPLAHLGNLALTVLDGGDLTPYRWTGEDE